MPVEPGMEAGRKERGRLLAETVPDGGACARLSTRRKGNKAGSSARTTGKRKSTRATY
jgi:hypothetical protein